jgi:hypothetical protein
MDYNTEQGVMLSNYFFIVGDEDVNAFRSGEVKVTIHQSSALELMRKMV